MIDNIWYIVFRYNVKDGDVIGNRTNKTKTVIEKQLIRNIDLVHRTPDRFGFDLETIGLLTLFRRSSVKVPSTLPTR